MRPHFLSSAVVAAALALTPALLGPSWLAPATADDGPVGGPLLGKTGIAVDYSGGAVKLPTIKATSWVLADATTGEVLAAKAPHRRLRPASTLKTLTAVTLLPRLKTDSIYLPVDADVNVEGSRAGIVPNAPYTIDDLFYAMLLPSGNDAATALARAAGSVRGTIALMKEKALYLHALDTAVINPTGLDADRQYSSAYDLALIARAGLELPDFRRYIGTLRYQLPGNLPKPGHSRPTFQILNQDRLLQDGYSGLIGGKTGYTTLAGRTFMAAAQRGNDTLIVTLLGIKEPSADAARKLLDWGFHNLPKAKPVGTLVAAGEPAPAVSATPIASIAPSTITPSASAAAQRSTSKGSSIHLNVKAILVWMAVAVGVALVVASLGWGLVTFIRSRRRGTEIERLQAAARRWNS